MTNLANTPAVVTDERVTAPAVSIEFDAGINIIAASLDAERDPNSWSITFGFGRPAERGWTEVRVPLIEDTDGAPLPDAQQLALGQKITREVARQAYGDAWAFLYRPDEHDSAVSAFPMWRREIIDVTVQVLS